MVHFSLCLPFILPLPLLYYNTTSCSIAGRHFKTVSSIKSLLWQHMPSKTPASTLSRSSCTPFGFFSLTTSLRAQTDGLEGDIRNPDCKHKNSAAVCRLFFFVFPFLKFSFTSMQRGKLRHIHTTSALSTSWGHELQRTNAIVDLPLGQVFITPWKPVYWLFTSFSFKAQDWNSGTRFTVVLSKSVQPVARMTHAVMQRNSGQIFLLNESAHQQYIQPSISPA